MEKNYKVLSLLCTSAFMMLVSSCGGITPTTTAGNTQTSSASAATQIGSGILSSLIGNVLGTPTLKKANLIGTWNYSSSDCKFESENFLQQAGGEIAAKTIENKLNDLFGKVGIKQGALSFTFNEDGSYQMGIGGRNINGTYTLDEETGTLTMVGMFGITKSEAVVTLNSTNSISILYDATKLMQVLNAFASQSGNTTVQSISSLIGSYNGLKIGFELTK